MLTEVSISQDIRILAEVNVRLSEVLKGLLKLDQQNEESESVRLSFSEPEFRLACFVY